MKNRKGFTLIELLAIIVILAVIAVITVPIILNIIDNAEKGSAQDSALGYKDALQKYYATKSVQNPEQELPSGYMEISELPNDFTVSGENPSDGWVKLKNGIVEKYSLKYKDYVVTMDNDKNVISEKKEKIEPHVTNDYQEVEYLESTGTQYIDTGVIPTVAKSTKIELNITTTNNVETDTNAFGSNNNLNMYNQVGKSKWRLVGIDTNVSLNNQKMFNIVLQQSTNGRYYSIDGVEGYGSSKESSTPFYICGISGTPGGFKGKTGIVKIYENNTTIRDFVPVVRKSDDKPGMLDLTNQSKNLFNPYTVVKGRQDNGVVGYENGTSDLYISNNTIYLTTNTTWRGFTSDFIEVSSRDYHIYVPPQSGMSVSCSQYDANKQFIKKATLNTQLEENCKYIRFTITFENIGEYQVSNVMLNEGTEALPYEPYGYKFYTNEGTGEFITGPEI